MTLAKLLHETEKRGITLKATPDGRLFSLPRGALPDDLRSVLREHKAELVRYLRACSLLREAEAGTRIAPANPLIGDDFGLCEVCRDPAAMVVPTKEAVHGARHFCGMACYQAARDALVH
jgi:tubulysin polyketide synthase-like protein